MLRLFFTDMPGESFSGNIPELSNQEILIKHCISQHINIIAGEIGERNIWNYDSLNATANYIVNDFKTTNKNVNFQNFLVKGKIVKNVEIEFLGNSLPEEIILIGAHYDSVLGTPGANDNGSGIAALLELAKLCTKDEFNRTIRFVAFVNEEPPFFQTASMGSWVYARRSRQRNEKIVAMFSLETIGSYSDKIGSQKYPFPFGMLYPNKGNFLAFVSDLSSRNLVKKCIASFRKNATLPSEGIAAAHWIPGISWSDQWAFWQEKFPAIMITDTAPFRYLYYHTAEDTPEKLDYDNLTRAVMGLFHVIMDLDHLPEN